MVEKLKTGIGMLTFGYFPGREREREMFAHFGVFKRELVHVGEHSYELGIVWHRLCCLGSSDFKWRKLPGSNHISHTSRVRASRVTEVSREGKACKDKGEQPLSETAQEPGT